MTLNRRDLLKATGVGAMTAITGCLDGNAAPIRTRTDASDWPLVYHDTHNSNHNPAATPPKDQSRVAYRLSDLVAPDDAQYGYATAPTPVITGTRLIVGGTSLRCYNAKTGDQRWKQNTETVVHGLATDGASVYAAQGPTGDATVTAYDVETGTPQWTTGNNWYLLHPPILAGDQLLVSTANSLAAVGLDGSLRWDWHIDTTWMVPPAATESSIYYQANPTEGSALMDLGKMHRRQGTFDSLLGNPPDVQWIADIPHRLLSSPVVADDTVLAGMTVRDNHERNTAPLVAFAADGNKQWDHRIGAMCATPAVAEGTVYVVTYTVTDVVPVGDEAVTYRRDATVRAYDRASGDLHWQHTYPNWGSWSITPVVADGVVYVGLYNQFATASKVVAIDASGERWAYETQSQPYHLAVVDDYLYATLWNGSVLALTE